MKKCKIVLQIIDKAGRGCGWIAVYSKSGQYYCPVKEEKRK